MKAGIVVDTWKLPVLEKHLARAGLAFVNAGPISDSAVALTVECEDPMALALVINDAMRECAKIKQEAPCHVKH